MHFANFIPVLEKLNYYNCIFFLYTVNVTHGKYNTTLDSAWRRTMHDCLVLSGQVV